MDKRFIEFIGTFFLVLTAAMAPGGGLGPIAVGVALIALVYMGGPVSGAHYNPAVSFAMLLARKMPVGTFVGYVLSQCAGAIAASGAAWMLRGEPFAVVPALVTVSPSMEVRGPTGGAFLLEVIFSFLLVLVILMVALAKRAQGNQYYGVAIGLTVMGGAFVAGPISGGSFNPAVGFVPALVRVCGGKEMPDALGFAWVPLYLLMPLIGAMLAVAVFKGVEKEEPAHA